MDALTGQVLYEQNPQAKIGPASFVKILTLYLVFDAIRAGQLKMDDMVTVSEKAWRIQGSKMFIKVGDRVKVEDLLKGIAISSGNDACIAIAEHMAGTEDVFVSKMNEKAASLWDEGFAIHEFPWDACRRAIHHRHGHGDPGKALYGRPSRRRCPCIPRRNLNITGSSKEP